LNSDRSRSRWSPQRFDSDRSRQARKHPYIRLPHRQHYLVSTPCPADASLMVHHCLCRPPCPMWPMSRRGTKITYSVENRIPVPAPKTGRAKRIPVCSSS
jgi:hypothetical protein